MVRHFTAVARPDSTVIFYDNPGREFTGNSGPYIIKYKHRK